MPATRVLMLTYPLTPLAPDACGGSEQIAWLLARGLAKRPDWKFQCISAPASWPALLARYGLARPQPRAWHADHLSDLEERCNRAVLRLLGDEAFDLVLNQGAFFYRVAGDSPVPVLCTLHLARRLYPSTAFTRPMPNLHLICVSQYQAASYGELACCGVIANGIGLDRFHARKRPAAPGAPLLYLGRICEEKAPHLAIALARRLRRPLWIVGAVAPFPSHQAYFDHEIAPALGIDIRWLSPPPLTRKLAMLQEAAAVVIPSQIEETSSLTAMEAAASGVPVLALRAGALPEIIAHGETGWLADDWEKLVEYAQRLHEIAPTACRRRAEQNFCSQRMVAAYAARCQALGNGTRLH